MLSGIVFVLVVFTHDGNWVPTLEFREYGTCMLAYRKLQARIDNKFSSIEGICVEIEK